MISAMGEVLSLVKAQAVPESYKNDEPIVIDTPLLPYVPTTPVPCRRQRFHAFAVTQPTHIDEISRYPIKLLLLPRTRHPRDVCQCQRNIVFAKQIG